MLFYRRTNDKELIPIQLKPIQLKLVTTPIGPGQAALHASPAQLPQRAGDPGQ